MEEEEEEDTGTEVIALRTTMAEEEEEKDMKEEEVPAMGRNENSAQRPLVMGGLSQATPWQGTPPLEAHCILEVNLLKDSGQTQTRRYFIEMNITPGKYQRGGKLGDTRKEIFIFMILVKTMSYFQEVGK